MDSAGTTTWVLTENGVQRIQVQVRLLNPRPALRRRQTEPTNTSTVFELLDYLDEQGWVVEVLRKGARKRCPPLSLTNLAADGLPPESMVFYVRDVTVAN